MSVPNAAPVTAGMAVPSAILPGSIEVGNKKVLILSPMYHEFSPADEGRGLRDMYNNYNASVGCPTYDVVYLEDSQAGVGAFKAFGSYGIVHVATHGVQRL